MAEALGRELRHVRVQVEPRAPRRRTRLWPRSCKAGDPGRHRRAAPRGCGVVETHHLAVVKSRVRFPVSAPSALAQLVGGTVFRPPECGFESRSSNLRSGAVVM